MEKDHMFIALDNDTEIDCPLCKQHSRKISKWGGDIYKCPDCGLKFQAFIQIYWDKPDNK